MKNERKNAEYGTGEDVERRHDWEREHAGRSRPHIAPCSCELHQALREALERNAKLGGEVHMLRLGNINLQARIRELETELVREKENRLFQMGKTEGWKARAEKAEAELDIAMDNLNLAIAERFEFAKRAEKRVKEREAD